MKGIWFGDRHSYDDLHLVLSAMDIPPATPKTNYVDIPGADGSVDLTEALGEVRFSDRECSFTFTAFPQDDFERKKREVSNLINGKRMRIRVDKDPGYYWEGRCSVNEYASDKNIHQIVVGAVVRPYKLRESVSVVTVQLSDTPQEISLTNGRKTVAPTLECSGNAVIVFDGNTFHIGSGTHKLLDIQLHEGSNDMTVAGSGTLAISYQEGDL